MSNDLNEALKAANAEADKTNFNRLCYGIILNTVTATLAVSVLYAAEIVTNPWAIFLPLLTLFALFATITALGMVVNLLVRL